MAANKCFVVLAPNGRRQNVKVTANTTILQVLEEVCKKQGFKAEEYDIKHHNHVLDTTQIIRFTGLPNNAMLEMAAAQKMREEKSVVLGLQLESGDRVMGDFLPTDSLWDVIKKLCPDEADPNSNPVIIYMRREVSGKEALEETKLRSLGLTGGRAMLRFVHRTPEELHRQANVSFPLVPKQVEKPPPQVFQNKLDAPPEHPSTSRTSNLGCSVDSLKKGKMNIPEKGEPKLVITSHKHANPVPDNKVNTQQSQSKSANTVSMEDHREVMDVDANSQDMESVDTMDVSSSASSETFTTIPEQKEPMEEIILLGERNAVAFSLDMIHVVPYEDLPDDFFDLTLEDARAVYRDLKRKRAEMEETPLATSAQRNLEESKRVLSQIHQYRRAVIRIQFPDRTVLQGTFLPLETISTVMDFVRRHLENPETEFYLYTTPPKNILPSGIRLVDANCVPSAMVHFGTDNSACQTFLREEILSQFSSPSAATLAACQSRGIVPTPRPYSAPSHGKPNKNAPNHGDRKADEEPSTSTHRTTNASRQPRQEGGGPSTKVPKWFKPVK